MNHAKYTVTYKYNLNPVRSYGGVATSMIARHKKPRHDLVVVNYSYTRKVVARLLKTRDHRGRDSTVTLAIQMKQPLALENNVIRGHLCGAISNCKFELYLIKSRRRFFMD